jgi:mRNA interferase MazF
MVRRFDVHMVALQAGGSSPRPCVVVSPDEMNRYLPTVIVAPLTTAQKDFPTRVHVNFRLKSGQVALEQLGVVEKSRLLKPLGRLGGNARRDVLAVLAEMFAE